jgi:hypothetical protein
MQIVPKALNSIAQPYSIKSRMAGNPEANGLTSASILGSIREP